MALTDDLISWWSLDEASGSRADSHGGNTLTDNNTVGSAAGKVSNAADFAAASSEYLSRADNADLSFADDPLTFAGWFRADSLATSSIFAKWASDGAAETCEYALRIIGGTSLNWRVANGASTTNFGHSTTLSTATWYFFAVYHDPSANLLGISIDGGAFETTAHSAGIADGAAGFAVGRTGDFDGQYYDGLVDELAVWGRVLSDAEVDELYNAGAGVSYADISGGGAVLRLLGLLGVGR